MELHRQNSYYNVYTLFIESLLFYCSIYSRCDNVLPWVGWEALSTTSLWSKLCCCCKLLHGQEVATRISLPPKHQPWYWEDQRQNFLCAEELISIAIPFLHFGLYPLLNCFLYQYIGTNCHTSNCKKAIKYPIFSFLTAEMDSSHPN